MEYSNHNDCLYCLASIVWREDIEIVHISKDLCNNMHCVMDGIILNMIGVFVYIWNVDIEIVNIPVDVCNKWFAT